MINFKSLKWIFNIYKKDIKTCLTSMIKYSFLETKKKLKYYIITFFILYTIMNYDLTNDKIISVSYGLKTIVNFIVYLITLFICEVIFLYFKNTLSYKKWNYGVNENNEKHLLIEQDRSDIVITEWIEESNRNNFNNTEKFIGLNLLNYKNQKQREDIINNLLKNN